MTYSEFEKYIENLHNELNNVKRRQGILNEITHLKYYYLKLKSYCKSQIILYGNKFQC